MIKAVLSDFDGTIVTKDILDVAASLVGKEKESKKINLEFQKGKKSGRQSAIKRINLLKNLNLSKITEKLNNNPYLTTGAKEFFSYLSNKNIPTILYSGNIIQILNYYQKLLGIKYIVGSKPNISDDKITGISKKNYPKTKDNWKLAKIKMILKKLSIKPNETLTIGNSFADEPIFNYSGWTIAINPDKEIKKYSNYVIKNDLKKAILIIDKLIQKG